MEKESKIYLEMFHRSNGFNATYGAELRMPCTDADIDDVKQKLRCLIGEEPVVDYKEFSLVPELDDVQIVGNLLEYNALAKRLDSLDQSSPAVPNGRQVFFLFSYFLHFLLKKVAQKTCVCILW